MCPRENKTADAQAIIGNNAEIAIGEPRGGLVHVDSRIHEKNEIDLETTGAEVSGAQVFAHDYEGKPTPDELLNLRRVADSMPLVAYVMCFAELCERASYYGTANVIGNFINRKLPQGGNGGGAPPRHDPLHPFGQTRKTMHTTASGCSLLTLLQLVPWEWGLPSPPQLVNPLRCWCTAFL